MRRPQFSLKTLLSLFVCIACFFGGAEWQKRKTHREVRNITWSKAHESDKFGNETIVYEDGLSTTKIKRAPTKKHIKQTSSGGRYVLDEDPYAD